MAQAHGGEFDNPLAPRTPRQAMGRSIDLVDLELGNEGPDVHAPRQNGEQHVAVEIESVARAYQGIMAHPHPRAKLNGYLHESDDIIVVGTFVEKEGRARKGATFEEDGRDEVLMLTAEGTLALRERPKGTDKLKHTLSLNEVERCWFKITSQEADGWIRARQPAADGPKGDLIEWSPQLVKRFKHQTEKSSGLVGGVKGVYIGGVEQALSALHLESVLDLVGGNKPSYEEDSSWLSQADSLGMDPVQLGEANSTFVKLFEIIDQLEARTLNTEQLTEGFKMVEQFWDGIEQLYPRSSRLHKQPLGVLPISSIDMHETVLACALQLANEKRGRNLPLTASFCEEWQRLENNDVVTYPPAASSDGVGGSIHEIPPDGSPKVRSARGSPQRIGTGSKPGDLPVHNTLWIGHLPVECVNVEDGHETGGGVFGRKQLAAFLTVQGYGAPKLYVCASHGKRMSWCLAEYSEKHEVDELLRYHAESPLRVRDFEGNHVPLAIRPAFPPGELQYRRLVDVLTDTYLTRIVIPALESWMHVFSAFALERNGILSYAALKQGLTAACSPDVSIIDGAVTMEQIMGCMVFTVRAQDLRNNLKTVVFDRRLNTRHRWFTRKGKTKVARNSEQHLGTNNVPHILHSHKTAIKTMLENDAELTGFHNFQATFGSYVDFATLEREHITQLNDRPTASSKKLVPDDCGMDGFARQFKLKLCGLLRGLNTEDKKTRKHHGTGAADIKPDQIHVQKLLPPGWNMDDSPARLEFTVSVKSPSQMENFLLKSSKLRQAEPLLTVWDHTVSLSQETMGEPQRHEAAYALQRTVDATQNCARLVHEKSFTDMGDAIYSLRNALMMMRSQVLVAKTRVHSGRGSDVQMHGSYECQCDTCVSKRARSSPQPDGHGNKSGSTFSEQLGGAETKEVLVGALDGLEFSITGCVENCDRMLKLDTALKAPLRQASTMALRESTFGRALQRMLLRKRLMLVARLGQYEHFTLESTLAASTVCHKSAQGLKYLPKLSRMQALARGSLVRRWYKRNTIRIGTFSITARHAKAGPATLEIAASLVRKRGKHFYFASHHYDSLNKDGQCFPSTELVLKYDIPVAAVGGSDDDGSQSIGFQPKHKWKAGKRSLICKHKWAPSAFVANEKELKIDYLAWPAVLLAYMNTKMLRSTREDNRSEPEDASTSRRDLVESLPDTEEYQAISSVQLFKHLDRATKHRLSRKLRVVKVSREDLRGELAKLHIDGLHEQFLRAFAAHQEHVEKSQAKTPEKPPETIGELLWLDELATHDIMRRQELQDGQATTEQSSDLNTGLDEDDTEFAKARDFCLELTYPSFSKIKKRGKRYMDAHAKGNAPVQVNATVAKCLATIEQFEINQGCQQWQNHLGTAFAKHVLRLLIEHLTFPPAVTVWTGSDTDRVILSTGENLARPKIFIHGERIIAEGDHADRMFIVKQGSAEAVPSRASASAADRRFGVGDSIGELSTLFYEPHSQNVHAVREARVRIVEQLVRLNATGEEPGGDEAYRKQLMELSNTKLDKLARNLLDPSMLHSDEGMTQLYMLKETDISTCLRDDAGLATEALLQSLTPRNMRRRRPTFPGVLLARSHMKRKLRRVTRMLHRWNQFITMVDRDDSGYLSLEQLRCMLLAFSSMGLIAERFEYHPLAENFEYYNDLTYTEADIAGLDLSEAPYYEVSFGPGKALILGVEGVPLHKPHGLTPWAMYVDFKLDPAMIGTMHKDTKFNVLVCSYQMAAIVVQLRLSDAGEREVRLLYVPGDVMSGTGEWKTHGGSSLTSRLEDFVSDSEHTTQYESDDDQQEQEAPTAGHEKSSLQDTAALTCWFHIVELKWYRLQFRATRAPTTRGVKTGGEQRFRVEIACFKLPNIDPAQVATSVAIETQLDPDIFPYDEDEDKVQNRAMQLQSFHPRFHWTGEFDMQDHFVLGNSFSTATMNASHEVFWSLGPLRAYHLFHLSSSWISERHDRSKSLAWFLHKCSVGKQRIHNKVKKRAMKMLADEQDQEAAVKLKEEDAAERVDPAATQANASLVEGSAHTETDPPQTWRQMYKFKHGCVFWNQAHLSRAKNFRAVEGRYCMVRVPTEVPMKNPIAAKKASRKIIRLRNKWNKDNEPDFKYSNDVIYRLAREFVEYKAIRTQLIQKAFFSTMPNSQHNLWELPKDVQLKATDLFVMRTEVCKLDPGLNDLFADTNLLDLMRHMTRHFKVNASKFSLMVQLFLFPIADVSARLIQDCLGKSKTILANPILDFLVPGAASKELMIFIRATTGHSMAFAVMVAPVVIWVAFAYTAYWGVVIYALWRQCVEGEVTESCVPPLEILHKVEPMMAVLYYLLACIFAAVGVSTELKYIPGNETWETSYQKAEVSTTPITLTKIADGLQVETTGMALLHLVSRIHRDFEKEKENESDLEDEEEEAELGDTVDLIGAGKAKGKADIGDIAVERVDLEREYHVGKTVLQFFWNQSPVRNAMPWLPEPPDITFHTRSARCSRCSRKAYMVKQKEQERAIRKEYDEVQKSLFEFQINHSLLSQDDYEQNDRAHSRSMQTRMDLGSPTARAEKGLIAASILNALLGTIHRTWIVPDEKRTSRNLWNTEFGVEHTLFISTCTCTVFASWYVYRTIYCTALRWYTCLILSNQLVSTLSMQGAIINFLPCYIDLRHSGNMEGWYRARRYFTRYTDEHVFGMKDQIVVATALVVVVVMSATAVQKYFGDSTSIDWTDPGPLISLLNMTVIGSLVFLAVAALERLNAQTEHILGVLDEVAIEVSRTTNVEQSVMERAMEAEAKLGALDPEDVGLASTWDGSTGNESTTGTHSHLHTASRKGLDEKAELAEILAEAHETEVEVQQVERMLTSIGHHLDSKLNYLTGLTQSTDKAMIDLITMQKLSSEAVYLANIMTELRDHPSLKTILGIVIDRQFLQRIFGASCAVAYLILKDAADTMLMQARNLAPPGFPGIMNDAWESEAVESAGVYECMLSPAQQALVEATAALNASCTYNLTVGPSGIRDWFYDIDITSTGSP